MKFAKIIALILALSTLCCMFIACEEGEDVEIDLPERDFYDLTVSFQIKDSTLSRRDQFASGVDDDTVDVLGITFFSGLPDHFFQLLLQSGVHGQIDRMTDPLAGDDPFHTALAVGHSSVSI